MAAVSFLRFLVCKHCGIAGVYQPANEFAWVCRYCGKHAVRRSDMVERESECPSCSDFMTYGQRTAFDMLSADTKFPMSLLADHIASGIRERQRIGWRRSDSTVVVESFQNMIQVDPSDLVFAVRHRQDCRGRRASRRTVHEVRAQGG